ncbi:MAG: hypothetical protein K2X32_07505 [Phycisphaerales bacterium]|nr:hypothetical protein [Phycisphaerales bacterium]
MNLQLTWNNVKRSLTPPRRDQVRDPRKAFMIGFLCGPIGLGVYLRSWVDLGASLAAFALLVCLPWFDSPGLRPLAWALWGSWAALRARQMNRALEASRSSTPRSDRLVVAIPTPAVDGDTSVRSSSEASAQAL